MQAEEGRGHGGGGGGVVGVVAGVSQQPPPSGIKSKSRQRIKQNA